MYLLKRLILILSVFLVTTGSAFPFSGEIGTVAFADLPVEAQHTIALIQRGGPYPYEKDGRVFGNFEGVLPKQRRGYYHEFTVKTPRARNRGARRIVTGGRLPSPAEYYYTDDHYATFKRIRQ